MIGILMPGQGKYVRRLGDGMADIELLRLVVSVEAYKKRHGFCPASFDAEPWLSLVTPSRTGKQFSLSLGPHIIRIRHERQERGNPNLWDLDLIIPCPHPLQLPR